MEQADRDNNNSTNSTIEKCFENLPSAKEFFHALEIEHKIVLTVPIIFAILTIVAYVINLRSVLKENVKPTKCNVTTLISIYPVS